MEGALRASSALEARAEPSYVRGREQPGCDRRLRDRELDLGEDATDLADREPRGAVHELDARRADRAVARVVLALDDLAEPAERRFALAVNDPVAGLEALLRHLSE